jgi:effector-binding domain-containing protein
VKKIISIVVVILVGSLIWYLYIKPYDYSVKFKAKTFPGTINQSIKMWSLSLENSTIIDQNEINNLKQKITFNDSTYIYKWEIVAENDSTSTVKIFIKDVNHSVKNRITFPFSNTDFEKRTKNTLLDFHEKLNEHIKKFKVTIKGDSEFKSTYCAYVPIKTTQIGKAQGMMENYSLLSSVLAENNVKLNGLPLVEITYWDMKKDSIHFNFCYPIIKNDSLPHHDLIKYKELKGKKALKAVYNGNYITSDRAWYALIDYANKNNIEIEKLPVEIFYNNPNMGGDELKWKAEIYLPIK